MNIIKIKDFIVNTEDLVFAKKNTEAMTLILKVRSEPHVFYIDYSSEEEMNQDFEVIYDSIDRENSNVDSIANIVQPKYMPAFTA